MGMGLTMKRNKYLSLFMITILLLMVFIPLNPFLVNSVSASWWNTDFTYYKTITIESDYIDNDLTNFPVLITIDDTTADKCNGGDSIRFLHSDETTEYYYEIEKWVDNEDRIVWVNVTSISSTVDTIFKMYYGNSGASDNQNPTNVWDNNYKLVCHLDDPDTGTLVDDSTANTNDGTKKANTEPERATGKIGYGFNYGGTPANDYINWGNIGDTFYGLSFWIKPDTTINKNSAIAEIFTAKPQYLNGVFGSCTGLLVDEVFTLMKVLGGDTREGITNDITNVWHLLTLTWDGDSYIIYLDGVLGDMVTSGVTPQDTIDNLQLGKFDVQNTLNMKLDEFRVYINSGRSSAWIKACYHSQLPTTGFMTFGSEQSQNQPPTISNENPLHNSTDISLQPTVNVTISDLEGDVSVCNFYTSIDNVSWVWRQTNTSILNESIEYNYIQASDYSTLYYWKVTANDTNFNVSNIYNFTTIANLPPVISNENPLHNSTDILLQPTVSVTITDGDGDTCTCNFYTSVDNISWIWQQTNTSILNESIEYDYVQASDYLTLYYWKITANDTNYNVSSIFNFTTGTNIPPVISNEIPLNSSIGIDLTPELSVYCIDNDNDNLYATWWSNSSGNWIQFASNWTGFASGTTIKQTNENFSEYKTTYYWSVNLTDSISWCNETYHFTTEIGWDFTQQLAWLIRNATGITIFRLLMNGGLDLAGDLIVLGNVNVADNVYISNNLDVGGSTFLGDSDSSDYLEVTESGVVTLHGDAKVKRHIRITAPSFKKGVVAPTDAYVGIVPVLSFDKNNDDAVHYSILTPYRIQNNSDVTIVVDWCYTGTNDVGTVAWNLSYINLGDGYSVDGTLSHITQTTTGTHTSGKLIRTEFTGKLTGAIAHYDIGLKLIRDVSEDTLDTDAHLIQVHFEFIEDKLGKPV